jgi:hypothetical protein
MLFQLKPLKIIGKQGSQGYIFKEGIVINLQYGGKIMRKQLIIIGMILLVLVGINECQAQPILFGRGTVKYIGLAGGFYGIVSHKPYNGTYFLDPIFMPFRFRHDGLHILFIVLLEPNMGSIHCWGDVVFIIKIIRWI